MNNELDKNLENLAEKYSELVDAIFRFIYFRTNNKKIAEDLTQDCFLNAVQYLQNKAIDNLKAFLYKTARNKVIDYYRRKDKIVYSDEAVFANEKNFSNSSDEIMVLGDAKMIVEKLSLLEPDDKEVLVLRFIEDFEIKEIAEIIGKSPTAARVKIFRALRKLRKLVK